VPGALQLERLEELSSDPVRLAAHLSADHSLALAGWPLAPASTSSGSRAARYHWLRRDLRRATTPADVMKSR
jgi:hypothetical protein